MQRVPAPIDREGVSAVLAPTLAILRALPPEAYLSPDVFARERAHFSKARGCASVEATTRRVSESSERSG